jgi:hypothetical protein
MSSFVLERPRAPERLLRHCALFGSAPSRRVPASRRLEAALGAEQARVLLETLIGDQSPVRRPRRRVRSSP